MQPFRVDDDVLRTRVAELEEELAELRERLTAMRKPAQLRVEQLEVQLEKERRLLASARNHLAHTVSFWANPQMRFFAISLFVGFLLLRYC